MSEEIMGRAVIGGIEIEHRFTYKHRFVVTQRHSTDSVTIHDSDFALAVGFMSDCFEGTDSAEIIIGGIHIRYSGTRRKFELTERHSGNIVTIYDDDFPSFLTFLTSRYQ